MSVEAISLALSIPVERSSAKFVLVAMANCANNDMICWPSIQYLSDATSQDRKTVIENIKRLREYGLIEETGEKRGSTGQIVVYRLTIGKDNRIAKAEASFSVESKKGESICRSGDGHYGKEKHYVYQLESPLTGQFYIGVRMCIGSIENDTYMGSGRWPKACEAAQIALIKSVLSVHETRSDAEKEEQRLIDCSLNNPLCMNSPKTGTIGTVPKTEPKSTVFSHKESRFSVERVPKTGHGTVKEPSKEPSVNHKGDKSLGFDPLTMVLPDCVSNASWAEWVAYRRERKLTVTKSTMESQASRLSGWSSEGYDPTEVIQESISNGWQGLFKPKNKPSTKTKSGALSKAGASTAAAVERWLTSEAV